MRPRVGDLVQRKTPLEPYRHSVDTSTNGLGIVLGCKMAGQPAHVVATVLYPEVGKEHDIAVSLIEVVSERR